MYTAKQKNALLNRIGPLTVEELEELSFDAVNMYGDKCEAAQTETAIGMAIFKMVWNNCDPFEKSDAAHITKYVLESNPICYGICTSVRDWIDEYYNWKDYQERCWREESENLGCVEDWMLTDEWEPEDP